jgi:c-di-GMP-binding flagellar brake protein YcgR
MNQGNPQDQKSGIERRRYTRISKSFILTYFEKTNPREKFEITQLRNISMGGLCFITTKPFPQGTVLGIELKTPYLSDTTYLEGKVLQSHEKVTGILYETRVELSFLDA